MIEITTDIVSDYAQWIDKFLEPTFIVNDNMLLKYLNSLISGNIPKILKKHYQIVSTMDTSNHPNKEKV